METRGQTFQFNLPPTSARGTLKNPELQAPRHPGFEPAERNPAGMRDAGYNIYLISLRNLIDDRMQSYLKTEPRESGKKESSQFSEGKQSSEGFSQQPGKGARVSTGQQRNFSGNVSQRDDHGVYLASANQFLLPKFNASPVSTPRSGEPQNKEPRQSAGRESLQNFSAKPTINQQILNEKKPDQTATRFTQQRDRLGDFSEYFSSKYSPEQKRAAEGDGKDRGRSPENLTSQKPAGREALRQRGTLPPARGAEAPTQRGAQPPARGAEAPTQRGAQPPARGAGTDARGHSRRGGQAPSREDAAACRGPRHRRKRAPLREAEHRRREGRGTTQRGRAPDAERGEHRRREGEHHCREGLCRLREELRHHHREEHSSLREGPRRHRREGLCHLREGRKHHCREGLSRLREDHSRLREEPRHHRREGLCRLRERRRHHRREELSCSRLSRDDPRQHSRRTMEYSFPGERLQQRDRSSLSLR